MTEASLDDLAREAGDGAPGAFERFVIAASPKVRRLAFRFTANEADAADLAQEVFVRTYLVLSEGRYRDEGAALAWLRRIVVRAALDDKRSQRRRRDREAAWSRPEGQPARSPHAVALREVMEGMAALPAKQRVALVLKELEGLSTKQIAEEMACSLGAVEQRLVRARAALRARFADEEAEG